MRISTGLLAVLSLGVTASPLLGQVPDRFLGSWVVDGPATSTTIAADPDMPPANKSQWTERWLSSDAELQITDKSVLINGLEGGQISLSVASAANSESATVLSATLSSPPGGMDLSIELRLTQEGRLNLRIREENDFDLVVWERSADPT